MARSKRLRLTFVINGESRSGTIYTRKYKSGIYFWVNFVGPNGRVRKPAEGARNEKEAAVVLQEMLQEAWDSVAVKKKCRTFEEFSELYMNTHSRQFKKSWKCDYYALNAHLKPFFGELPLDGITPFLIEQFRSKKLKEGLSAPSTNRLLALLKSMYSKAQIWNHFTGENPVKAVTLFSERDNLKQRILSPAEEEKIKEESADHLRPIIITALNTGMRKNEILSLESKRVDLERRIIEVVKTKSGMNRSIPINDVLYAVLKEQKRISKSKYVFPHPETGEKLKTIRRSFTRAYQRANIPPLRFHDLRHTFAVRCIRAGVDIHTLKELLGNHSVTVTERYLFSGEEQKRDAVNMLSKTAGMPFSLNTNLNFRHVRRHAKKVISLFSNN